ncbi:MAG: 3-isopropylmalate dehydratase small subunit, partial [Alphaproteobacteria bacterium]
MEAFTSLTAVAVPVDLPNVDTDQIIPARFLGRAREEQAPAMFHDMRRASDGSLRHDFPLNQDGFAGAGIIVAERNFACGSSRENAV